ncbi:MAG TPA: ABC transporter substrate-binding protein [Streptosporangiaceae bacterium]|nr:ABC transporter substrate-binding protein [Streptosporangiaceae bacterium]
MDHGGSREQLRIGACLSLSGKFSRFGRQAAHALGVWASLDDAAEIIIEDDGSDVRQLQATLPGVAARSDLLLGPYSTLLMRAAGDMAAEAGWLAWNHGGSGDDVETAHPGHVVSVLTPTSRYAEPFLSHLAARSGLLPQLRIAHGKGKFGRQVASGTETRARQLGFTDLRVGPADEMLSGELPGNWVLVTAATFEEDTQTVTCARALPRPPHLVCSVAAGVREFGEVVENPDGIFGIAQWFPGTVPPPLLGPAERTFLDAYHATTGQRPDYPAVQAFAAAALAAHCARQVGSTSPESLWPAATALDTSTLFGGFKIDQNSGAQVRHQTVLLQWANNEPAATSPLLSASS